MAEELEDGEFWLPSEILTHDDILMDLDLPSSSSLTPSTQSDTDEDDPSKGLVLSSSPKSTLWCGFAVNQGSSRGSPVGMVSPPPVVGKQDGGATWDLLYKAAGEVARMKVGTGFFDCSTTRQICPPPPVHNYFQPHFAPRPHIRQQQGVSRIQSNERSNNRGHRLLGLPPSAWPPLQAQKQQYVAGAGPAMFMGQHGPKRESVGTGAFLPRRPTETRKKREANGRKAGNGKGGPKSQQQRTSRPPTSGTNPKAIQLPLEWTY